MGEFNTVIYGEMVSANKLVVHVEADDWKGISKI